MDRNEWLYRLGLFLLFLICGLSLPALSGLLVFPFSFMIPPDMLLIYRIGLPIVFLASAIFLYSNERLKKYWQVFFAFFIASFAIFIDSLVGSLLSLPTTTMDGIAAAMVSSTVVIVVPIVVLTRVSGGRMASIFLKKGNIRLGLVIGLAGFFFFAADLSQTATWLFQGQNISLERVILWTPWILAFVMANGVREELLYRGLFLKKYEPLLGSSLSNLLQALIFGLSHTVAGIGTVAYTPYLEAFVLIVFVLGLVFGYVMQRTDSLLGSVLFHAGVDIPAVIGIFSNL